MTATVTAWEWACRTLDEVAGRATTADRLELLVRRVAERTGATGAWAVVWESLDPPRFRAIAAVGGVQDTIPDPRAFSRTVVGEVARSGAPIWSDTLEAVGLRPASTAGFAAWGCVPIGRRGTVFLGSNRRFDPDVRRPVELVGRLAGSVDAALVPHPPHPAPLPGLTGASRAMAEVSAHVRAFAPWPWPLLLLGEVGVGKSTLARALHALSPRSGGPFVAQDCSLLPPTLAESTLFGHVKGAFTGAHADVPGWVESAAGGTLFLDEVGELPAEVQARLLRLVQEGVYQRVGDPRVRRFEGRILAATHRPVQERGFREDLLSKLAVCVIRVPPLRERKEDVPALARELFRRHRGDHAPQAATSLSDDAVAVLMESEFRRANVRELENRIKRAIAWATFEQAPRIEPKHLAEEGATKQVGYEDRVAAFERSIVLEALAGASGNVSRTAEALSLDRNQLNRILQRLDLRADLERIRAATGREGAP